MSPLKTTLKLAASVLLAPFYVASKITKIAAQYTVDVAKFGVDFFLPGDSKKDMREKAKGDIDVLSNFTAKNYDHFINNPLKNSVSYAPKKAAEKLTKFIKKAENYPHDYDLREVSEQPNHSIHPTSSSPISPTQQTR